MRYLGLKTLLTLSLCALGCASALVHADTMQAVDTSTQGTTRAALMRAKPTSAKHAMVVTAQHLATDVGTRILEEGGNAIDAAVAIGYAEAVVHPCCGNLGGGGFMTIHLADGTNAFLDFRETAPHKARKDMFLDHDGQIIKDASTKSYFATAVPGTVMGLNTALQKYGSMPLAKLIAPAIDLATKGYVLKAGDARILARNSDEFAEHDNVAAIFLNDGKAWKEGERLIQKDLANTLKVIAKKGSNGFYKGAIAHKLVHASQAHDGLLSMEDLAHYSAKWRTPITCDYKGYTIVSAPPPSSGGVTMCQILGIIEPMAIEEMGYGTVDTIHFLTEAERRAFADRNTYLGDPDFITNPIDQLLERQHLADMRQSISADHATPSRDIHGSMGADEGHNTTHYSIMDKDGNAVSVTYTINYLFGNGQIAGDTGFFLNNEMDDFTSKLGTANSFGLIQGKTNQIEPGKRPLSSMTPTIVLHDNKPFMVTGSPGGATIISTTLQTILNVIDFGMNAQQAANAPRMHHQWWPEDIFVEPGLLTPASQKALENMGHTIKPVDSWGAAEIIVNHPTSKRLDGANDRRRPAGKAAGY